jgi:ribosomal-protein-alanine N-acetyltransferase
LFDVKDLTDVTDINLRCLPENYSTSFFLDIHRRYPRTFIVATLNGKVVGYIMCRTDVGFSGFRIAKKGHVISLAVLSEHRGKGIARALLSKALGSIAEYGVGECYLEVRVSNKPALDLYQNMGFEIARTIKGYYRNGENAHLMTKRLEDK